MSEQAGGTNPQAGSPAARAHGYGMGSAPVQMQGQANPYPYAQPPHPGAYADGRYWQAHTPYGQPAYAQLAGYPPQPYAQAPQQVAPRRRKGPIIVGIVVALAAIAAAILLAFSMCTKQEQRRAGIEGQLDGKTDEEIRAELDRVVSEGMFNISIASVIQFDSGDAPGDVRIENVPGNPYLMQVAITLDDTGETVYTTDVIEQNHHIQQDTLDVDLPQGTYNATATFTALDPATEEEVGTAGAKVVLEVLS